MRKFILMLVLLAVVAGCPAGNGGTYGKRHSNPLDPTKLYDPLDEFKDPIGHEIRKELWGDDFGW